MPVSPLPLQARLVVLGGAFHTNGNVNPAAEANIYGDPDAANVVFGRWVPAPLPFCQCTGGVESAALPPLLPTLQALLAGPLLRAAWPAASRRLPNCWVVGLDVTHRCRLSAQQIEGMAGVGRHGTFLRDISQFYLEYHRSVAAAGQLPPSPVPVQRAARCCRGGSPAAGPCSLRGSPCRLRTCPPPPCVLSS